MSATNSKSKAAVLFDGDCALCCKSRDLLQRFDWNHNLRYVNMRDESALEQEDVTPPDGDWLGQMHVVAREGKMHSGYYAIRWILWRLPMLCWIAPFLYIPGIPPLGEKAYLWVAKNRFRLVPCHNGVCSLPMKPPTAKAADKTPQYQS